MLEQTGKDKRLPLLTCHMWNNCSIKNAHKNVRTNRKRQETPATHMSHVYQNCQRANGLAWTG